MMQALEQVTCIAKPPVEVEVLLLPRSIVRCGLDLLVSAPRKSHNLFVHWTKCLFKLMMGTPRFILFTVGGSPVYPTFPNRSLSSALVCRAIEQREKSSRIGTPGSIHQTDPGRIRFSLTSTVGLKSLTMSSTALTLLILCSFA